MFDSSNKIARAQIQVADMQQSLRIAQYGLIRSARIAGRGWLLDPNLSVEVWNDAAEGDTIVGPSGAPELRIRPATDVLVLRGVITGSLYKSDFEDPLSSVGAEGGSIVVRATSPEGIPQELSFLSTAIEDNVHEALIIVSPLGEYAFVELDPQASADNGDEIIAVFKAVDGVNTDTYIAMSPPMGWLSEGRPVAMVGIFEELRYYVRENQADTGDPLTPSNPRLSYARVYPGSNSPWRANPANLRIDIADDIIDLQVALGIDRWFDTTGNGIPDSGDGVVDEGPSGDDEWFFNHPDDDATYPDLVTGGDLHYLRISTLARTQRRDIGFVSPPIDRIEDHAYSEPYEPTTAAERAQRRYQRRLLQTIVDLRNL
jgi:hypothetical protein